MRSIDQGGGEGAEPDAAVPCAVSGADLKSAVMIDGDTPFEFRHRHLLGIEGLVPPEISLILDRSEAYVEQNRRADKTQSLLRGRTIINLFFEASTRTSTSFELAGKRLGADVINMSVPTSSVRKGETVIDTAMTLNAMHPDVLVVRHPELGAVKLLSEKVNCAVINAGDGTHEHPTQALLDALTIRRRKGRLSGLKVAICGDILHSRVARSNIHLLNIMGARVRVVAPRTLLPRAVETARRRGVSRHERGPARLRHRDDAALADGAHAGQLHSLHPRVFPLLRPHLRKAAASQRRGADHASRAR